MPNRPPEIPVGKKPSLTDAQRQMLLARVDEKIQALEAYPIETMPEGHPGDLQALEKDIERLLEKLFGLNTTDYKRFHAAAELCYSGSYTMNRPNPPAKIQANVKSNIQTAILRLKSVKNAVEEDLADAAHAEPNAVESARPNRVRLANEVFVVHGHDQTTLQTVARTIEKLGLRPIILNEEANQSLTIIEKLERSSDVGFAVVLFTPDDVGSAKGGELQMRARQNVVAEMFYFMGKLGRSRVCMLKSDGVEIPSDLGGVTYHTLDLAGSWKFQLCKELKAAGYSVDANSII